MAEAGRLNCPSCGAPTDPAWKTCDHCGAALHPVRCPWCFQWTYAESADCPRCRSKAVLVPADAAKPLTCPSCKEKGLAARELGGARLWGCACGGVWADADSFKKLCEDREAQTAYLGTDAVQSAPAAVSDPSDQTVVYRPCAVCGELMNRFNFSGSSGVILDACKPHGVWFDKDELRRIVSFILSGGLDAARARERAALEEARRQLQNTAAEQRLLESLGQAPDQPLHVVSASALLKFFL